MQKSFTCNDYDYVMTNDFIRLTAEKYTGATAIVAGWGATAENGNWSCAPREAELPVLSQEACQNTKYNASKIKDVMLCAGFPETAHKDACTVSIIILISLERLPLLDIGQASPQ